MTPSPTGPKPLTGDELEAVHAGERVGMFAPPELVARLLATIADFHPFEETRAAAGGATAARSPGSGFVTRADVVAVVTRHYGVSERELCGPKRTQAFSLPRQVCLYLLRTMTPFSLAECGATIGGRDHTTVLYSMEKVEERMKSDPKFAAAVERIRDALRSIVAARNGGGAPAPGAAG